jgi:hypothetical protein
MDYRDSTWLSTTKERRLCHGGSGIIFLPQLLISVVDSIVSFRYNPYHWNLHVQVAKL